MTDIFKEIRSAVISAESTASFPLTRILRILGIARAWYYRHLDPNKVQDKRFNPYVVRDAGWIHWIQEGTSKAWVHGARICNDRLGYCISVAINCLQYTKKHDLIAERKVKYRDPVRIG
ncbi:MAG: hypothetical protein M1113_05610 [Candidatus Thermoplasmatota archaeon]|nr:hypothetical protein [Candidatus Thermoplasmatota archaeon]